MQRYNKANQINKYKIKIKIKEQKKEEKLMEILKGANFNKRDVLPEQAGP